MEKMGSHWLVRSRLKTRHLLLLTALDEFRNVHRASDALAMSQPAASKLLIELEDALGVTLFDRNSKGVTPTWYGETMVRYAKMALANLDRAYEELSTRKAGLTGTIRIGTIVGPTTTLLPKAIQKMNQLYPGVQISVTMDLSRILLQQLLSGELDFLIARLFKEDDKSGVSFERLGSEPVALIARLGHPLVSVEGLTLVKVLTQLWVLPPRGGVLRHVFDLAFRKYGLMPPKIGVETLSLSLTSELIQSTDMIAIMSTTVADLYVRNGIFAYLPVEFECDVGDYGLIAASNTLLSPSVASAMDFIREEAVLERNKVLSP